MESNHLLLDQGFNRKRKKICLHTNVLLLQTASVWNLAEESQLCVYFLDRQTEPGRRHRARADKNTRNAARASSKACWSRNLPLTGLVECLRAAFWSTILQRCLIPSQSPRVCLHEHPSLFTTALHSPERQDRVPSAPFQVTLNPNT